MAPKKSGKKRKKATPRQMKLIEERAKGKSYSEAAIAAGYSEKNARQSGYQALQQLRGRVPDLLDRHGLSEEVLIDKYLRPLLTARKPSSFRRTAR
jgi:Terminase small subunit